MLFGRFANENRILSPHHLVLPCEMGNSDMKCHEVLAWKNKRVKKSKYISWYIAELELQY